MTGFSQWTPFFSHIRAHISPLPLNKMVDRTWQRFNQWWQPHQNHSSATEVKAASSNQQPCYEGHKRLWAVSPPGCGDSSFLTWSSWEAAEDSETSANPVLTLTSYEDFLSLNIFPSERRIQTQGRHRQRWLLLPHWDYHAVTTTVAKILHCLTPTTASTTTPAPTILLQCCPYY